MSGVSGVRNLKLFSSGNFRFVVWEDFDRHKIVLSIVDISAIPPNATPEELHARFFTGTDVKDTLGPVRHLDLAIEGTVIAIAHDEEIGNGLFSIALCETFNGNFPFNTCAHPPEINAEAISSVRVTIVHGEPVVLYTSILAGKSSPGVFRH